MSETMVERVARAMWDRLAEDGSWAKIGKAGQDAMRASARAAIAAMRIPSGDMIEAGLDWQLDGWRSTWEHMIDAALAE